MSRTSSISSSCIRPTSAFSTPRSTCSELDREKLLINLDRYGNTTAGSVPLALDEAFQQGRVHRGDNILLSGFGAGLTWGTAILRW